MNSIGKNETIFNNDLKEYFKADISKKFEKHKFQGNDYYAMALLSEFKKLYWAHFQWQCWVAIPLTILLFVMPFYLMFTIDSSKYAPVIYGISWLIAFGYISNFYSKQSREIRPLINSKFQAYKELLREVLPYQYAYKWPIFLLAMSSVRFK